ncbi:hypothetical protein AAZX31_15G111900 [Glycine max]|uniref:BAH domain-containing protein n=1 Tax=Glycine max TaxID=3847 RepID=I1MFQ7_SOYBN|nr:uncharacterized protein LOC100812434 [Glycine max]KAG4948863.1 hypothetical protein JHK86_042102 [Glycine max]KAH1146713.1 hypothetical protein GYH30_042074 [Glycine max]KRH11558.1 hypothetical protein GLYMA_15G117200v4 [Glycine max]|eukprot:XP_006597606.1 uncharacterized protein LOC100812434 [Glycine max]
MSGGGGGGVFVTWEEQVICQERGNRVIHFYLKDALGNSVLAVVGTERSVRHMMYVAPDHFLQAYGSTQPINAFKWRARREVVDWLTCLVSRNQSHHAGVQLEHSAQADESLKTLTPGINVNNRILPDKMISRKLKFQSSDIEWSGFSWFCAKQLKHYSGFCRNGTTINVHSFVYIMAEEENHYLGYLEDMYEDKKRQKKVKVRWFHRGQEVKHVIAQLKLQEGEVFITPHVQVISAECVNGPATVLTPKHYEKYLAAVSHTSLSEIHMCFRQFKNNKLKPFALTKLRGYSNQSVVSSLNSSTHSKRKAKFEKSHTDDDENFTQDDPLRSSNKRVRSSKDHVLEKGFSGLQISLPTKEMAKCEPKYPSLKLKLSRKTMGIKVIGPKPQLSFQVGAKIEVLCQDSGIRGCWFRCKILSMSPRLLKVQYDDLLEIDGPQKLEEWVPASRVAAPGKLGMRCSGRLTVRPCPPEYNTGHTFEIGAPVDAWWCDGWWEGVITAVNVSGDGILQVYTPGEERFLKVEKKNIRISRDWINNRWVDIQGKPDICSYLSSNVRSSIRMSANSAAVDASMSDCSAILESKASTIAKVEVAKKVEPELSGLEAPVDLENKKGITLREPLYAIHEDKDNNSGGIRMSANSAVVDASMSDGSAILKSKPSTIAKVEVAKKVEPELSGLEAPLDLENKKGITLREPLYVIHEDKDNNSGGGCDDDEADKAVKTLLALNEHKDKNSGGGSDSDTDNDDVDIDTDNDDEDSGEDFNCSEPKLNAAEAIQVA